MVGEGVSLLVGADEEDVAGHVVRKGLIVNGADAHFEIADHDIALTQRYMRRDHHRAEVPATPRVSSAWRARSASFHLSFIVRTASSLSVGLASAQALA